MTVESDDVKMAIIRGKYDIYYQTVQSFILNLYNLTPEYETTPLLPLRILQFMDSAYQGNMDNDARYVLVTEIVEYFHTMNIDSRTTHACLDAMLARGLCLSYDPTAESIKNTVKIEISTSGQQHLTWSLRDWVYFESMAEITPLYDSEACDHIRECLKVGSPHLRRTAISTFIQHLVQEDTHFCVIPRHAIYQDQERIRATLLERLSSLSIAAIVSSSGRYHRLLGRITTWKRESGFGFIRQDNGEPDAFLHIRDIQNADGDDVPVGAIVEYDAGDGAQGPRAVAAVILE